MRRHLVFKRHAYVLILLVLLPNLGLALSSHYCGDRVFASRLGFGVEAVSCGMERVPSCPSDVDMDPCCDDEVRLLDVTAERPVSVAPTPLIADIPEFPAFQQQPIRWQHQPIRRLDRPPARKQIPFTIRFQVFRT